MVGDIAVVFEGSGDFSGEGVVDGCECSAGGEVVVVLVVGVLVAAYADFDCLV